MQPDHRNMMPGGPAKEIESLRRARRKASEEPADDHDVVEIRRSTVGLLRRYFDAAARLDRIEVWAHNAPLAIWQRDAVVIISRMAERIQETRKR